MILIGEGGGFVAPSTPPLCPPLFGDLYDKGLIFHYRASRRLEPVINTVCSFRFFNVSFPVSRFPL